MNSSIYYFLYLKLSKLNNVTILGAALFVAKTSQHEPCRLKGTKSTIEVNRASNGGTVMRCFAMVYPTYDNKKSEQKARFYLFDFKCN